MEEAEFLSRHENEVRVFPASLQVRSMEEARRAIHGDRGLELTYKQQLVRIVRRLINAGSDEGITTDELGGITGLTGEGVRKAMSDLARLGLVSDDTVLTAYVHQGVHSPSRERFIQAAAMEEDLIGLMQEQAPHLDREETVPLYLREASQRLKHRGHKNALPLLVQRSLKSIVGDGFERGEYRANMRVRTGRNEVMRVTLLTDWSSVRDSALRRRQAAETVLAHLLQKLDRGARGADLLVETTVGQLTDALAFGQFLAKTVDADRLLRQALLWLHDQEVIRLNRGMSVFRSAMTIRLNKDQGPISPGPFRAPADPLCRADAANPHHG